MCLMFTHAFFCCSVLGAFFVYLILDIFMSQSHDGASLGDSTVMALLSVPFLFIFIIGCHSMYLSNMVYDEIKARRQESLRNSPARQLPRQLLRQEEF